MRTADVVIIGAGVIGCSIAYHLASRDPSLDVLVLEREEMIGMGSTAKATGGIRHQFSTEPNIRLTQLSLPLYLRFEEATGYSVHFQSHGYLFLTTESDTLQNLQASVALQQSLGVPSRMINPTEAAVFVPGIRTDDLRGGSFCGTDGTAEPAAAVQGFAARARALGVQILTNHEVVALLRTGERAVGVQTHQGSVHAPTVVIAGGPYSAQLAAMVGLEIPAHPYRRQVSVAAPIPQLDVELPLTVDIDSGFYLHRMGHGDLLLGGTDKDVRPGTGLEVDWAGIERVLAAGARRIPMIEHARVKRTYVGLRSLTPDHHPILGHVEAVPGLVLACGDSGHGFMHAPAIGLLVSEEILDGRATTLDLTALRLERFVDRVHAEANVF
jgi:sarcosine oxidase subunit beta